jgi:hypothetical protein
MKTGKIVLYVVLFVVGLTALSWGAEWFGIIRFGFFEVRRENVRREVFEQTQSYTDGKLQELTKDRTEYLKSKDPQVQGAISMKVAQSCAKINPDDIKDDELRRFLVCMKNGEKYVVLFQINN